MYVSKYKLKTRYVKRYYDRLSTSWVLGRVFVALRFSAVGLFLLIAPSHRLV